MFFKKKQQHNPNIPGNLILHLLLKYMAGLVGSTLGHTSAGVHIPFLPCTQRSLHLGHHRQFLSTDPKCRLCKDSM